MLFEFTAMTKLALYGYVRGFMLSVIFPLVLLPVWRFVFVYCLIAAAAFSSSVRLYNLVSKMFQYLINGLYNSIKTKGKETGGEGRLIPRTLVLLRRPRSTGLPRAQPRFPREDKLNKMARRRQKKLKKKTLRQIEI
jgi:hypothetical protein